MFALPLIAFLYYASILKAFFNMRTDFVRDTSDILYTYGILPVWGTHWVYRICAETAAVCVATFICAGIAREKARTGGVIAGSTIAFFYSARLAITYLSAGQHAIEQSWHQSLIDIVLVFASPLIGIEVARRYQAWQGSLLPGFAGIARLHFIWLWLPLTLYSSYMLPAAKLAFELNNQDSVTAFLSTAFILPQFFILLLPLTFGIYVLAGRMQWSKLINNVAGSAILIVGFFLALFCNFLWTMLFVRLGILQL